MGCDETSTAALVSAGLTNETSTFPAARFRPAPRFVESARPRPPPPGGGLGEAPPLPRDASSDARPAIDSSIVRSRGASRRRVGGRIARHARDPNPGTVAHAAAFSLCATFHDRKGMQMGRFPEFFFFFSHLLTLYSLPSPLSRPRSRLDLRHRRRILRYRLRLRRGRLGGHR